MSYKPADPIVRFWAKVDKSGGPAACWLWQAATKPNGYGHFGVGTRLQPRDEYAHRYAWELANGPIPPGMCILHRYDVRNCVNPAHLFIGTNADNMADCVAKGRMHLGARDGNAKLTAEQVLDIRARYAAGTATRSELAQQYGIVPEHVTQLTKGRRWQHLNP